MRSKPKHEHLLEDLHVLIEVEGAPGVAEARFHAAAAEIKHICLPVVSVLWFIFAYLLSDNFLLYSAPYKGLSNISRPTFSVILVQLRFTNDILFLSSLDTCLYLTFSYLNQDPLHDQIKNEQLRELAVLNGTFQPDYLGGSSSRGEFREGSYRFRKCFV